MGSLGRGGLNLDAYGIGNLYNGDSLHWTSYLDYLGHDPRGCDSVKFFFQTRGDNNNRTLFTGFNDTHGVMEIMGSDSASKDYGRWSFRVTTPAYGVTDWTQDQYGNGGWNTGSFGLQLITNGNNFDLQFRYSSYYNSVNTGSFYVTYRSIG